MTTLTRGQYREALYTDQGVVVRLQRTDSGQTWTLAVRSTAGPDIPGLHFVYGVERTADLAYRGMTTLFSAGCTVAAVVDFAKAIEVTESDKPETLLTPCATAA